MQPIITFMSRARARVTILWASYRPVLFISLMLMPSYTPLNLTMSGRRWKASSAMMGSGERSRSQAVSSIHVLSNGCSTKMQLCSLSQWHISRAYSLLFQPWLQSTQMGTSGIISLMMLMVAWS